MSLEEEVYRELDSLTKEARQFGESHKWQVSYLLDILIEFEQLQDFWKEKSYGRTTMANEEVLLICRGLGRLMTDDPIFFNSDIGRRMFDIINRMRESIPQ